MRTLPSRGPRSGALLFALTLAALVAVVAPASAATQTITSSGPLSQIAVSDTLGCQVTYEGADPPGQLFDGTTNYTSCGTALAVGNTSYSFIYSPSNPTDAYFDAPFTPVSQSTSSSSNPMVAAAEHELERAGVPQRPGAVLADAGYWSNGTSTDWASAAWSRSSRPIRHGRDRGRRASAAPTTSCAG